MKRINLLVVCCLLAINVISAQEFPGYGILNTEEINLKQCDFDKDANAVVLLHEAFSDYDDEHHLITFHHVRIKILKEKGFSAADVSLPFYRKDDFEKIDMIEGMTINNTGGNLVYTRLDKKSIFTQKVNERTGQVVFTFPAIQTGSIIDYKYRSFMKHYGGLEDWNFQETLPVLLSKYTLIILPNMEFTYRVNKTLEIPIIIKKETSRGGVYFEMGKIPGLSNEPYMDARRDYLQKIIFQLSSYGGTNNKRNYMSSWDEVSREMLTIPEFGTQIGKNIPGTDDFIKMVKSLAIPEEKMKAVFNYVRSNMNWNGANSKYSLEGIKEAWQKKSGNSGDINLILVNLLKAVSLETYPMLVSERFHGKVNTAYPFIDQFNSVFACVSINDKKYYLDATDKTIPAHLTPSDILNTTAFIVNRKLGGLVNITNDSVQFKEYITAQLQLSDSGTITGDVTVKSSGYARVIKLQECKADKNKFLNNNFVVDETSIAVKDIEVSNMDNDSMSLDQHGLLSGSLNSTGEYSFLPLNLFTGFDENPFLSDNRYSNINFGYRRTINMNISIKMPDGYTIDEVPKSVKLTNPEKDIIFIRQVQHEKETNYIRCMMLFEFKKSLYETDYYPIIKEVYQKVYAYLKEPVVLKKKG